MSIKTNGIKCQASTGSEFQCQQCKLPTEPFSPACVGIRRSHRIFRKINIFVYHHSCKGNGVIQIIVYNLEKSIMDSKESHLVMATQTFSRCVPLFPGLETNVSIDKSGCSNTLRNKVTILILTL